MQRVAPDCCPGGECSERTRLRPTATLSHVAVARGRLRLLKPEDLNACSRTNSHIASHDAAVVTVANGPRSAAARLISQIPLGILVGIPFSAAGSLVGRTVSCYREFAADAGSAMLTGEPEH